MLGLPLATEVKKIIPKRVFFNKFQLSAAEQKEFDSVIRQLVIVNKISLRTVPALQDTADAKPIFVLVVQLKHDNCPEKILEKLCRLIKQRLLLALQYEDKLQLALCFDNRIIKNTPQKLVAQRIQMQGTSLKEIFENLALAIANLKPVSGLTGADVIANAVKCTDLEKQIAALSKKMFAEKQARKKLKLREQLNLLKKELGDLI